MPLILLAILLLQASSVHSTGIQGMASLIQLYTRSENQWSCRPLDKSHDYPEQHVIFWNFIRFLQAMDVDGVASLVILPTTIGRR